MSADREMIRQRPVPGHPRPYEFPYTARTGLRTACRLIVTPMPGRELVSASLAMRAGASDEPARRSAAQRCWPRAA